MIVQINAGDVHSSDALTQKCEEEIASALKHVADQVTRVEVHLHDENAHKSSHDDKRCTMEARIAGQPPLAVDASHDDLYHAIHDAAQKLGRAVTHKLDKLAAK